MFKKWKRKNKKRRRCQKCKGFQEEKGNEKTASYFEILITRNVLITKGIVDFHI